MATTPQAVPPTAPTGQDGTPTEPPPVNAPAQTDRELAALRQEVSRRNAEVEELKRRVMATPAPVAQQPDPTALKQEFFKNPIESTVAIAQHAVMQAQAAAGAANYDTLVTVAQNEAKKGNEDVWEKFGQEIQMLVRASVQPQFHTNVNIWRNAINQVVGQHINEVLELRKQAQPGPDPPRAPAVHVSREVGPTTPSRAGAPSPPSEKLSAEEHQMAQKLKISDEQYLAGKKFLEGESEKGPSSWDDKITTSTREQRRQRAARNTAK